MSPFIILSVIFLLYVFSRPKLRRFVERDGIYLSRSWTCFVNAFFISLVVCSHGLILFQTSIRDYLPEKFVAATISQFGQLMVATFFFYSGYGIMYSLLTRGGGYANRLIFPRFVQLGLNYVIAVMLYFLVHCILKQEIIIHDFLRGLHDYGALGNPTWFIIMTLMAYILTFISFKAWGQKSPIAVTIGLTGLLIVAIYLVHLHKPSHWVNTILCFPTGMLFYLKGTEIEQLHKETKIPSLFYALLLMVTGRFLYGISSQPLISICTQNLGSILFAIGVTWFVGSFSWKSPSRFLIWLGGSGLFVVYMFHLLPMRIITALEFNLANPYLIWFCVITITAVLAISASYLYKIINNILFIKI